MSAATVAAIDTPAWASFYFNRGWRPIPIGPGLKSPYSKDWPTREWTVGDFGANANLGLHLTGLTDVDLDSPEAVALAPEFLPPTATFGRASKPHSHWIYECATEYRKFTDPVTGSTLLENRSGAGKQTMAPPSVHPSGEQVQWTGAQFSNADPSKAAARLAAASLLARYWPGQGSRDDAAMALAGALVRAGWQPSEADAFVTAAARAAGDDEWQTRAKAERTAETLASGGEVTGLTRLRSLIDARVVDAVRDWLELPKGDAIATVDEDYFSDANLSLLCAGVGQALFDPEPVTKFAELKLADATRYQQVMLIIQERFVVKRLRDFERLVAKRAKELSSERRPSLNDLIVNPMTGAPKANEFNVAVALTHAVPGVAYDEFSHRTLVDRVPWVDGHSQGLAEKLQKEYGIEASKALVSTVALSPSPRIPRIHVIQDYFRNLPAWDGQARLEHLPAAFGVEPSALAVRYFRNFTLAAVRRVFVPGTKYDDIVTVVGKEGIKKSTGFRVLAVRPEWFADSGLDLRDLKGTGEKVQGIWIYELQELEGLRKADVQRVKAFARQTDDRFRGAYKHVAESVPRQCVFAATTNEHEFLTTYEGDRHFAIMTATGRVDVGWLVTNLGQLWAEAYQAAQTNEPHWIEATDPLFARAAEDRERYRQDDPQLEAVRAWLVGADPSRGVTTREVLEGAWLITVPVAQTRHEAQRAAAILRKLGWGDRRQVGTAKEWRYFPKTW